MEKKNEKILNYEVRLVNDLGTCPISAFPVVEPALALALELHRVANLPHKIEVFHEKDGVRLELVGVQSVVPVK